MIAKLANPISFVRRRRWTFLNSIAFVTFALTAGSGADEDKQPLIVRAPPGWKVQYKGSGLYSVKKTDDVQSELLIAPALPLSVEEIRAKIDGLAKAFVARSKQSELTKLDRDDYALIELKGEEFAGFYTEFTMRGEQLTATFAIRSADEAWWGQYAGAPIHWPTALSIIKSLKKNR